MTEKREIDPRFLPEGMTGKTQGGKTQDGSLLTTGRMGILLLIVLDMA